MKIFLFGAGATHGTFPKKIPIAREFGVFLNKKNRGLKAFPAIKKAVRHLKLRENDFTLEEVWTAFDFYAKLQKALPTPKPWKDESPDIKKAILKVYGKCCDRLAGQITLNNNYTLGRLMKNEVSLGDILVSFNYDTLIERLAKKQFLDKLRSVAHPPNRKTILLSKPHGSTSWTMDFDKRKVTWHNKNGTPVFDSLQKNDVKQKREPLVLGTVPIKSELIREVQCSFPEIFEVITSQWKTLAEALIKADTLVIVGYSFPREDLYGRFIFKEAMLRRKKKKLHIQFFELPEKSCELCREIFDVFGGKEGKISRIGYMGKVEQYRQARRSTR